MYDDMHHNVRAPKPWIRWMLLIVVLTLVLVVGYVIGVSQSQLETAQVNDTASSTDPQDSLESEVITADTLLFQNEELGIRFRYPAIFGETDAYFEDNTSDTEGVATGKKVAITFANTTSIQAGAITLDYSTPRGSSVTDIRSVPTECTEKLISKSGIPICFVYDPLTQDEIDAPSPGSGEFYTGYVPLQVTGYSALGIVSTDITETGKQQLLSMLDSVEYR